jgi:hypothetical protein
MSIITLEEYKNYEGLIKTDQDVKFTLLIESASNLIKTYLGSIFAPPVSPIVEYISVDYDTDRLWPKYYPITNLISVEEPDRYSYGSTVHIPLQVGTDYVLDGDSILRIAGSGFSCWPISPTTVKVTYVGGYTDSNTPAELKLAAIELVNYYRDKGFLPNRSMQGATIITSGTGVADLPPHVRAILDYYKI